MMATVKKLLFVASYAYPEFDKVFSKYPYQLTKANNLRKALASIKQLCPQLIVAEFVYAPTYGSQLSNFESLFAAVQTFAPNTTVIAMVHKEDLHHLEKISGSFKNCQTLILPIKPAVLADALDKLPL